MTVDQVPYIPRILQVHQVMKPWNEAQATSAYRETNVKWSSPYLHFGVDDTHDASFHALDSVLIHTYRPSGWVEFDITTATNLWKAGQPNYGVVVWATNEDTPGRDLRFASKSASDTSTHAFVNVLCDYSTVEESPEEGGPRGPPGGLEIPTTTTAKY